MRTLLEPAVAIGAAVAASTAILALAVWLIGRAEDRHEVRERAAIRDPGSPVLGGAPRHMRRRPPT